MTQLPLPLASRAPRYVSVSAMEENTIYALRRRGPSTADELAECLELPVTSIRPRLTELEWAGRVERTEERRITPAGVATGRRITAAVYRVVQP
jgi:predicted Rossmann fold nucleotide-binding protein DprA/Smf involved in DNA uptake